MAESFLSRIFKKKPKLVDSWDYVGGLYVGLFRQHLDVIASALSLTQRQIIQTCFNTSERCAEFRNQSGYVIAQIWVHGEMCRPYEAIVNPSLISEAEKALFELILPTKAQYPFRVEFRATRKVAA